MVLLGCGVMQFQNGVLLEVSLDPHLHLSLTSFWHKSQQRAAKRNLCKSIAFVKRQVPKTEHNQYLLEISEVI